MDLHGYYVIVGKECVANVETAREAGQIAWEAGQENPDAQVIVIPARTILNAPKQERPENS